jgi:Resolvase, N terminal domain
MPLAAAPHEVAADGGRTSGESQVGPGVPAVVYVRAVRRQAPSAAEQLTACRRLCREEGYDIIDVVLEIGEGGRGVYDALEAIATGRADLLVTYDIGRFGAGRQRVLAEALVPGDLVRFVRP